MLPKTTVPIVVQRRLGDRVIGGAKPLVALPVRPKLGDEVTRYLRDAIVSGAYRFGSHLRIENLAREIGVSTMPVREALITLANEGLVELLPRRGFRVARIDEASIKDSFKVHAFVAGLLAEEATRGMTSATIASLKTTQSETAALAAKPARTPDRSARLEQLNYEFHRTINWASDSARLRWFLRAATRYVPRHFYEDIPGWIETTLRDHPRIISALERRDEVRARTLVEQHVQRAGELILANLAGPGGWLATGPSGASDGPTGRRTKKVR